VGAVRDGVDREGREDRGMSAATTSAEVETLPGNRFSVPFSAWAEIELSMKERPLTAREFWAKLEELNCANDPFSLPPFTELTKELRWDRWPDRASHQIRRWIRHGRLRKQEAGYSIIRPDLESRLEKIAARQGSGKPFTRMEEALDLFLLQREAGGPFFSSWEALENRWGVRWAQPILDDLVSRAALLRQSHYQMAPRRSANGKGPALMPVRAGSRYKLRQSAVAWLLMWEIDPHVQHRQFHPIDMCDDLVARYEAGEWFTYADLAAAWGYCRTGAMKWLKTFAEALKWIVLERKEIPYAGPGSGHPSLSFRIQKLQPPTPPANSSTRRSISFDLKAALNFLEKIDPSLSQASLERKRRLSRDEYWILLLHRGKDGQIFEARSTELRDTGLSEDLPGQFAANGRGSSLPGENKDKTQSGLKLVHRWSPQQKGGPSQYQLGFDHTRSGFDVSYLDRSTFLGPGRATKPAPKKKRSPKRKRLPIKLGIGILREAQKTGRFALDKRLKRLFKDSGYSTERTVPRLIRNGGLWQESKGKGRTPPMFSVLQPAETEQPDFADQIAKRVVQHLGKSAPPVDLRRPRTIKPGPGQRSEWSKEQWDKIIVLAESLRREPQKSRCQKFADGLDFRQIPPSRTVREKGFKSSGNGYRKNHEVRQIIQKLFSRILRGYKPSRMAS
jgi:hypothetical protein